MTIHDLLRNSGTASFKKYTGEVGIEIETETKNRDNYPDGFLEQDRDGRWTAPSLKYWDVHVDGSLRDFGLEYVLKQPLMVDKEVPLALEEFATKTAKVKFIKDSVTTSVHVHVNMLNETFITMGNFFTLYCLFENLLIRYSGPDRLSNLFCLPICDAEDTYKNMVTMMQAAEARNYRKMFLSEANVKYAALNVSAFRNFGSVEIRSFRGETDTKLISNWVNILYKIMVFARKAANPKEIMLQWKERQGKFVSDVFNDQYKELVGKFTDKEILELVDQNTWYAASVAYGVKNWKSLDEELKAPEFKPKTKDLDQAAMNHFGQRWVDIDPAQQEFLLSRLRADHEKKYFAGAGQGGDFDIAVAAAHAPAAAPVIRPAPRARRLAEQLAAAPQPDFAPNVEWGQLVNNAAGVAARQGDFDAVRAQLRRRVAENEREDRG